MQSNPVSEISYGGWIMREKQCMTAVLLAGGKSSRMGYHPKQQLMLDGESFQTRILKQLQGFGEIAI